ncbi:lasso peptide biosynthesis PqqD family chaperone [Exiguobacterium sp. JMULE1]|uniref:lasso peptide biosynthesis PqqD family chaperone n=1 Tax=Exiguobacterium sp. JMULE1 TaxID=2518339 RepID=UPI0015768169|nr:lasso peptide biosynthesis PqqD family chaperone [Exiguobacterium sp. JMULE1]NTY10685.1 lasso peptide biosynthesis PqqD family chaperone [Exiguobacterium sp. JMULE1]
MEALKANHKFLRKEDILASEMDGEIVMMSVTQGKYFSIGQSGVAIWGLLDQERTVTELVHLLRERYEVDEERCRKEVTRFVELLVQKELVEVR